MYLVINKCVTAVKVSNFSCHYLCNRSTLDIGVLGYIRIVQHKEHSPEVLHIPPGTSCIGNVDITQHYYKLLIYFTLMIFNTFQNNVPAYQGNLEHKCTIPNSVTKHILVLKLHPALRISP